eukprot:1932450-Rhodomonas_salina.3
MAQYWSPLPCYAMSGTFYTLCPSLPSRVSSTDLRSRATMTVLPTHVLRGLRAAHRDEHVPVPPHARPLLQPPGMPLCYLPTRLLCPVQYWARVCCYAICLRAVSGTAMVYADTLSAYGPATPCPVLRCFMLLPGVHPTIQGNDQHHARGTLLARALAMQCPLLT